MPVTMIAPFCIITDFTLTDWPKDCAKTKMVTLMASLDNSQMKFDKIWYNYLPSHVIKNQICEQKIAKIIAMLIVMNLGLTVIVIFVSLVTLLSM